MCSGKTFRCVRLVLNYTIYNIFVYIYNIFVHNIFVYNIFVYIYNLHHEAKHTFDQNYIMKLILSSGKCELHGI